MIKVGDIVKIIESDVVGVVTVSDATNETLRIKIISGRTSITDYYWFMVEQLNKEE